MVYFVPKSKIGTKPMTSTLSRQSPRDPRRQRLLETALALLLTVGYDDATTTAIAKTAHLSKATLYTWWSSKESLFMELIGRDTVQLLDDWMAGIEADPAGGTVGGLYRQGIRALVARPLMSALYGRESRVLGSLVRKRGPAIYTPRYVAGLQMVQALQDAGVMRANVPAQYVNHLLLLLQVGLVMVGQVFDPGLFPPFEPMAQVLGDLMQDALAPQVPVDPTVAKAAIRAHFAGLRALVVASFAAPDGTSPASS
jgi:AcrR family transcriptional regulator